MSENKIVGRAELLVEERVSKAGKTYRMVVISCNGKKKDFGFLTEELEFALYKAGLKL